MCFRVKKGFHLLATLNSSLNNHGEYIIGLAVLYGGQTLSKCTTRTETTPYAPQISWAQNTLLFPLSPPDTFTLCGYI